MPKWSSGEDNTEDSFANYRSREDRNSVRYQKDDISDHQYYRRRSARERSDEPHRDPGRGPYDDRGHHSREYRHRDRMDDNRGEYVIGSRYEDGYCESRRERDKYYPSDRVNVDERRAESEYHSSKYSSYGESADRGDAAKGYERKSHDDNREEDDTRRFGKYDAMQHHDNSHGAASSEKALWYNQKRYQPKSHKHNSDHASKAGESKQEGGNSWRKNSQGKQGEADQENSATILVRNLGSSVTAEDVETVVSDMCIKNGFSAPNSVSVKTVQSGYNTVGGMYSIPTESDSYAFGTAFEVYAVVTFPSPENAAKFMHCVKCRKLDVNGVSYYVEYDTLDVNAETDSTKNLTYEDINELKALMKKRIQSSDWMCPNCKFINFARRAVCLTCNNEKPSEDVLQSQNLLVDAATTAQAQFINSNVTDLAPCVVLKCIPMDADPAKLVHLVCSSIPGSVEHLQRCIYVIDPRPQSRFGFMFCHFSALKPIEDHLATRGDKLTEILAFQGGYLRLDIVKSREKQVAEELFKNIKMNTLKVTYELNKETQQMTILPEDASIKKSSGKEICSCKIRTTSIGAVENASLGQFAPPASKQYLSSWLTRSIPVPTGKPDTSVMTYDPKSDYFYDHRLGVYYDAATEYYISVCGIYYTWDDRSSSIVIANNSPQLSVPTEGAAGNKNSASDGNVAGLLEAAMKAAQVTNEISQSASSVVQESEKTSSSKPRTTIDVSQTFDKLNLSDDECDMEVDATGNDAQNTATSDTISSSGKPTTPIVKSLIVCLVCLRKFDEQIQLEIHERRSQYHNAMLQAS